MKLLRVSFSSFLLISLLLLQGCISIFKTSVQEDVTISTKEKDPDTEIKVEKPESKKLNGDSSKGKLRTDLSRKQSLYQVRLSKKGFLDEYRVAYKEKVGALSVIFLILDVGAITVPYNIDMTFSHNKIRNYPDPLRFESPDHLIPNGKDFEKGLYCRGIYSGLEKGDTVRYIYTEPEDYYDQKDPQKVGTYEGKEKGGKGDGKEEGKTLLDRFNDLLVEASFLDTNRKVVLNDYNRYMLTPRIQDFTFHFFPVHYYRWKTNSSSDIWGGEMFELEMQVKWELRNNFGELVYDTVTTGSSGEFCYKYIPSEAPSNSNCLNTGCTGGGGSGKQYSNPKGDEKKDPAERNWKVEKAMGRALKGSWVASMEAAPIQRCLLRNTREEVREKMAELDPIT
ncbi:MAG: hypothetical protein ABEH38_07380, partial [Flavobacteriales bacterium]